ncbi:MAG: hypothetical protein M2R45_03554 [Verrucomicrobia subdivision 3 bacterium]|nr:hypothetical protein [Limisphaerales bacterium]MCS1416469.1 hypothetical protein [Limisphaerales bacterium]
MVFIAFRHLVHSRHDRDSRSSKVGRYWVFIAFRHLVHSRHSEKRGEARDHWKGLHCLSAFSSFTTRRIERRLDRAGVVFIAFRHLVHSRLGGFQGR